MLLQLVAQLILLGLSARYEDIQTVRSHIFYFDYLPVKLLVEITVSEATLYADVLNKP